MHELLRGTMKYYSPQHAQIGQFSTIVSMRGRFLFQRSAVPRTRAPSWGDISCTRTRLSTHRRRRGPGTPEPHTPPVWRAPEGQEGLAAAPVGGGGAWLRRPWAAAGSGRAHQNHRHRRCGGRRRIRRARAGFEIDHSEPQARVWRSRGRPGPTAPGTPAEPQATSSIANSGCAAGADGSRAGRRPRAHQAARPHSRIRRRPEHQRSQRHDKRAGTSRFRPALYAQW